MTNPKVPLHKSSNGVSTSPNPSSKTSGAIKPAISRAFETAESLAGQMP